MAVGVRQDFAKRANAVVIASDETAVVTRIAVRAPTMATDDDERRTTQDGRQSRSYMAARNMAPLRIAVRAPTISTDDDERRSGGS